jgi:hypothetical protein
MRELIEHIQEADIFKPADAAEVKRRWDAAPTFSVIYKGDRDHPDDYDNFTLNKVYQAKEDPSIEGFLILKNDLGKEVTMSSIDFDMSEKCDRCGKEGFFEHSPEYDVCVRCDAILCPDCGCPDFAYGDVMCKAHRDETVDEDVFKPASKREMMARKTAAQRATIARRFKDTWQDRILGMEPEGAEPVLAMWFDEPTEDEEEGAQIFTDFANSLMQEYQIDLSDLIDAHINIEGQREEVTFCEKAAKRIAKAGLYVYDSDTRFEVYTAVSMGEEPYESVSEADVFEPASEEEWRNRSKEYLEKLKSKHGTLVYFVDFDSWTIHANSANDANAKALAFMAKGNRPEIQNVEQADDDLQDEGESIEMSRPKDVDPLKDDQERPGAYYVDFSGWMVRADNEAEAKRKALAHLKSSVIDRTVPDICNIEYAGASDKYPDERDQDYTPVTEAEDVFKPADEDEMKKRREDYEKAMLAKAEQWVAIAKRELEAELEVEVSIDEDEGRYVTMSAVDGKGNNGESEWIVFPNSETAEGAALDRVREDLESDPVTYGGEFLQRYIMISDTDRSMLASDEADSIIEGYDDDEILSQAGVEDEYAELQQQLDDLDPDAEDYDDQYAALEQKMEEMLEDAKETIREQKSDEIEDALLDPVQYFVHDQGMYSIEDLMKANFITIDYDEAAQDIVNSDGAANTLDGYDGAEVELPSGAVAFGTN